MPVAVGPVMLRGRLPRGSLAMCLAALAPATPRTRARPESPVCRRNSRRAILCMGERFMECGGRGVACCCGGTVDGFADAVVAAATADIPLHGNIDVSISRLWRAVEQSHGAHDLAGLAITALRYRFFDPGLLNELAFDVPFEAFDGRDLLTRDRRDGEAAGADGGSAEMNGAGAALGDATAELGPFEPDEVPDDPKQGHVRFGIYRYRLV